MNQKKTGAFLKVLRAEKGMTQAQLAEKFNISNRTVSRWETGSNMPDLSLLVELADFYEVDIREIIDGERKSETMNEELKSSILKVAEYTENEKSELVKRLKVLNLSGIIGIAIYFYVEISGYLNKLPIFDYISGVGMGIAIAALVAQLLYMNGLLYKCQEKKSIPLIIKILLVLFVIGTSIAAIMASI